MKISSLPHKNSDTISASNWAIGLIKDSPNDQLIWGKINFQNYIFTIRSLMGNYNVFDRKISKTKSALILFFFFLNLCWIITEKLHYTIVISRIFFFLFSEDFASKITHAELTPSLSLDENSLFCFKNVRSLCMSSL